MSWNGMKRGSLGAAIGLSAIIVASLALSITGLAAAQAQSAASALATPEDDAANSAAAMKETVHDPRINDAKTHPSWGMWDIGRPHPMKGKGAFDDHDPIGVAAGKLIPTDCSVYWSDPDTHQVFCFGSQASLVYFLSAPKTNAARALKRWPMLKGTS